MRSSAGDTGAGNIGHLFASRKLSKVLTGLVLAAFALVALQLDPAPASAGQKAKPASKVLTNGAIYTVDSSHTWAKALAIRKGRIVFVGSNRGARRYIGKKTEVINLKGHMVMPGLQDSHVHPIGGGAGVLSCSLDYARLTEKDFQDRIQSCLDSTKDKEPDGWLEVGAWNAEETQPPGTFVTKGALDALSTSRPILVSNSDGHKALANSRALELAGIDDSTPDPDGGVIDRDSSGEATGLLFEDAKDLVTDIIPGETFEDQVDNAEAGVKALNSVGVTSMMDAAGGPGALKAYASLRKKGKLTMRTDVATVVGQSAAKDMKGTLKKLNKLRKKYRGNGLRAGTVKIFADGVIEYPGQTAAMLKPYLHNVGTDEDPKWVPGKNRGLLQVAQKPFNRIATALDRHGWQIHVHAIGDRAVRTALNAFATARKANHRKGWGNRDTIAHLQEIAPKDIRRFAKLKVIPNFEMQWFQRDGYTIDALKDYMGPKRFKWMYPAGSLVKSGATMAAGSDWPVDPLFPFYALERGVTRTADSWYGYDDRPLGAWQSISLSQAIKAYTMSSAFQLGQNQSTGSLQKGKKADLIELNQNLFRVNIDKVSETKVLRTMIGGKTVYRDK